MGELTITISVTTVMLTNCQPCCVVETNACCAKVALTCLVGMSVTIKCLFDRSRYFLLSVAGTVAGDCGTAQHARESVHQQPVSHLSIG